MADVAIASTPICLVTGQRSLSPTSSTRIPIASPCGLVSAIAEEYGLTTFHTCAMCDGVDGSYFPMGYQVASSEIRTNELPTLPFGQSLSASLAPSALRDLSDLHLRSSFRLSLAPAPDRCSQ